MQQITSTSGLKEAIRQLEEKSDFEGVQLKMDFQSAVKSLNPFNILKGTMENAASAPLMLENILGTVMGLATGYLTKKIVVGKSGNKLRILIGSIVQYGVLNYIAQRSDALKSIGLYLVESFLRKKEPSTN